ncbi:MAG: zf-HC2 domain-containing protein [Planctomycetia bacterium]|nr:MAG: zf-HC2 domain-containing protein [Planctomycetia bacterium]
MTCAEANALLSRHLDCELDEHTAESLCAHLDACPACRCAESVQRRIDAAAARTSLGCTMPADVWNCVTRAIRSESCEAGAPRILRLHGWAAVAAVVVMAFGGWWVSGLFGPRDSVALPGSWIVAEYENAVASAGTFRTVAAAQDRVPLGSFQDMCLDCSAGCEGHEVRLVSIAERVCRAGTKVVEVRLTCCGEPVVVKLAPAGCRGRLKDVAAELRSGRPVGYCERGVHVAAQMIGPYVAVSASRHPLSEIWSLLRRS